MPFVDVAKDACTWDSKENRMRTQARTAAVILVGALALTACGGGDADKDATSSGSGTSAADPAKVSGELTWWDTSDAKNEGPVYKALIKEFNKEYPNVKIDYQSVPFGDAQNKFKTAAQAKSGAPDILRAEVAWVPEFASLGYLYELDGTALTEDQDDFLPAPVGSTQYEGKTYGVPQVTDSLALMYNKKLFKEAGVNEPPTTWEEMKTAAKQIKDKTGKDGVYLNPAGYYLLPFIYGEGGDLIDADAKKITVNSAESVAGVKIAQDLLKAPGFSKPPATDAYPAMMKDFTDGEVAMIIQGPWEVKNISDAKKFGGAENLGIAPVPAGSKKAGAPVGGHDYVVWSGMDDKKADAAIAFIQFMTSTETQAKLADELGVLPTRTSAYDQVKNPVVGEFKPVMEKAVERAWIPEGGKLFGPLDEAATKLMVQDGDAQQTLDGVAKKYKSEAVKDYATE